MAFPDEYPAFSRLLLDNDTNLWVQDYPRPGVSESTWRVFRDGVWIASVDIPRNMRVFTITSAEVIGTVTDSLGVEYIRVHRIAR
jgi:hypothetical protein